MKRTATILMLVPAFLGLLTAVIAGVALTRPVLSPAPIRYLAPVFAVECAPGQVQHCAIVKPGQTMHWTSHIAVSGRVDLATNASVWSLSCDRAAIVGRYDTAGTLTIPHAFADYAQRNSWTVPETLAPGAYQFTRQTRSEGTKAASYDVFFVVIGTPPTC